MEGRSARPLQDTVALGPVFALEAGGETVGCDVEHVAHATAEGILAHARGEIGHVHFDAASCCAMKPGDRAEASLLRRIACMDLEHRRKDLGAILMFERGALCDRLAPRVEPWSDREKHLPRRPQRAGLPERQEAMEAPRVAVV